MSFDVNILCNGNRCKQYKDKNGRTYIESKIGTEYVVEIKNNSWEKVLAVVSVDGLNVIDGETADENGPGYVIDRYCSQKLYGFQYSQDKVAAFKFGAFGDVKIDPKTGKPEIDPDTGKTIPLGYAASKNDGSEKNAGVIGLRIWDEVLRPKPPPDPYPNYALTSSWSSGSCWSGTGSWAVSSSYAISGGTSTCAANSMQTYDSTNIPTKGGQDTFQRFNLKEMVEDYYIPVKEVDDGAVVCASLSVDTNEIASFDMETQWGDAKSYKVKETTFERKSVIFSLDIYYASRESLIAMGVDVSNEKRVSFPESFKTKYATPPKGWKG